MLNFPVYLEERIKNKLFKKKKFYTKKLTCKWITSVYAWSKQLTRANPPGWCVGFLSYIQKRKNGINNDLLSLYPLIKKLKM